MNKSRLSLILIVVLILSLGLSGCGKEVETTEASTITVTDQLGRTVTVPTNVTRVAGTHIFGPEVVYSLGQGDKLTEHGLSHKLGAALDSVDPVYAKKPVTSQGMNYNIEAAIALKPQVAFVNTSTDQAMIEQFENAGIKTVAVRGETLEESYEAVRIISKVLECEAEGEAYIADCEKLVKLVEDRIGDIPEEQKPRVMLAGPKSVYSVASGDMLASALLEIAGGISVSKDIQGYWTEVSPEQVAKWNPEVIILGSSLDTYGDDKVFNNPHFKTVAAINNKEVYTMPSNIGWWDYPAPNCVLGAVWLAKTMYPEKFTDVDMLKVADDFYKKRFGHTFTEMGGKL